MDGTNFEQMLDALAQGDKSAFQQFYDQYGLPVYRYLLEKNGNPERTRQLWKEVFRTLMSRLRTEPRPDLPLLLLTALADLQLASDTGAESAETQAARLSSELADELSRAADDGIPNIPDMPNPESPAEPAEPPKPSDWPDFSAMETSAEPEAAESEEMPAPKRHVGPYILIPLLIVIVLILLWAGAGFAMANQLLPSFDLGYSWFNRMIFPFFPSF